MFSKLVSLNWSPETISATLVKVANGITTIAEGVKTFVPPEVPPREVVITESVPGNAAK